MRTSMSKISNKNTHITALATRELRTSTTLRVRRFTGGSAPPITTMTTISVMCTRVARPALTLRAIRWRCCPALLSNPPQCIQDLSRPRQWAGSPIGEPTEEIGYQAAALRAAAIFYKFPLFSKVLSLDSFMTAYKS